MSVRLGDFNFFAVLFVCFDVLSTVIALLFFPDKLFESNIYAAKIIDNYGLFTWAFITIILIFFLLKLLEWFSVRLPSILWAIFPMFLIIHRGYLGTMNLYYIIIAVVG